MDESQVLFELPIILELRKSAGGDRRIVRGYASTEAIDQDGEVVLQNGIDFTPLIESGYLNYDHYGKCLKCGTMFDRGKCPNCGGTARMPLMIGVPIKAEIRDKGLWVEGELFNSNDVSGVDSEQARLADEMWAMGMMLQKSGQRSLAYSVEGGVVQKQGKRITKSIVRGLAITHKPVNTEATIELFAKSLCCGRCNPDNPLYIPGHTCGDHSHDINKALSTETAAPLMVQDLDRGMSSILYGDTDCNCYGPDGKFIEGINGAAEHLQRCCGLTKEQSINFLRKLIHNAPARADLAALVTQAGLIGK